MTTSDNVIRCYPSIPIFLVATLPANKTIVAILTDDFDTSGQSHHWFKAPINRTIFDADRDS
ncbi:MAG: hypothetical protein KKG97_10830 [Proteobacteria bacterium]|nr:hypothetical protein [Pseudomonadota bacterium]